MTPPASFSRDSWPQITPRRVVFLSVTHRFDDTRVLHKEAKALASAGFDVVHLAPDHGTAAPAELHGVHVVLYQTARGPARQLRRCAQLWWRARHQRAQVLHANEVESWIVALLVKLERPRMRVVFDVHEHYPSRFSESRFPRWLRWVGEPLIRLLFHTLTPVTDHLIFAKRSIAKDFPARSGQASFVFNYAPLNVHESLRDQASIIDAKDPDRPVAVHVGDLSRDRGWPQLLEALRHMRHRELRVIQYGGIEGGAEPFWTEARRLGVHDRIDLRERVPYDDLFDHISQANVGLMLYQPGILNHVYAFPMKLYDYMRAGVPSIGPRFAVEVAPVIEQEQCGWLIDTANARELADVLDMICENRDAARAAGDRGRNAVRQRYNWEQEATRLVALYRRLMDESGSTTRRSSVVPVTADRSTSTSAGRSEPYESDTTEG